MARIVIGIGGMSCQGCVKNVTGVLRDLTGVESVEVSLDAGQASIDYDPAIADVAQISSSFQEEENEYDKR